MGTKYRLNSNHLTTTCAITTRVFERRRVTLRNECGEIDLNQENIRLTMHTPLCVVCICRQKQ